MAQPLEKWVEDLEKEVAGLSDQLNKRARELQQQDPIFNGLIKTMTEKQGAMNYLRDQIAPVDKVDPEKPKKKKDKK